MSILVTGGAGFIGTNLVNTLIERGEDVVILDIDEKPRLGKLLDKRAKFVLGDVSKWAKVLEVVKKYEVKSIFHLAALLSAECEQKPYQALETNITGTFNVLEVAKQMNVEKVIFTSTTATYGLGIPKYVDESVRQEPTSIYGDTKVFGELLGLYYHIRHGLDFRCVRLATVIGPGRAFGGMSVFSSHIIERPAIGLPYSVFVREDIPIGIFYIKDAIDLLIKLHDAKSVKTRLFNSGSMEVLTKDLVDAVKKYVPDAKITFEPDPLKSDVVASWPILVGKRAEEELGWKINYDLDSMVKDFVEHVKQNKEFYLSLWQEG
jgi:nucleoside-diphosphate-sugar epimerase